eukprot:SAG31_NODE_46778_length_253_cov_0.655844_1_plen_27_part_10
MGLVGTGLWLSSTAAVAWFLGGFLAQH